MTLSRWVLGGNVGDAHLQVGQQPPGREHVQAAQLGLDFGQGLIAHIANFGGNDHERAFGGQPKIVGDLPQRPRVVVVAVQQGVDHHRALRHLLERLPTLLVTVTAELRGLEQILDRIQIRRYLVQGLSVHGGMAGCLVDEGLPEATEPNAVALDQRRHRHPLPSLVGAGLHRGLRIEHGGVGHCRDHRADAADAGAGGGWDPGEIGELGGARDGLDQIIGQLVGALGECIQRGGSRLRGHRPLCARQTDGGQLLHRFTLTQIRLDHEDLLPPLLVLPASHPF